LHKDPGLNVVCLASARAVEAEDYLTLLDIVNLK